MKKSVVFWGQDRQQIDHVWKVYEQYDWKCKCLISHQGSLWGRVRNLWTLVFANTIYVLYGFDINTSAKLRLCKLLRKRIIIHWIGTDVLKMTESFFETGKRINEGCINLAVSEQLCNELGKIGIEAKYVPIVATHFLPEPLEMPDEHAVMVYAPKEREEFYGLGFVKELAKRFPNILFYIVANEGGNAETVLDNIHYLGWLSRQELKELYKKVSILFRYPQHDGLPVMLLEALGFGKQAIYRYEFPFAIKPASEEIEDISFALTEICKNKPSVNYEAIEYVKRVYSFEGVKKLYKELDLA